jgi:hypothetical protein
MAGTHRLNIGGEDNPDERDDVNPETEEEFTHYLHLADGRVEKATIHGDPGNHPTVHREGKKRTAIIAVAPREWEEDE